MLREDVLRAAGSAAHAEAFVGIPAQQPSEVGLGGCWPVMDKEK